MYNDNVLSETPNRITMAFDRMKAQIEKRISDGLVTVEKVEETRLALDMDFEEYCRFQELKSLACASGKLSLEEGMTIYSYLGTTPDKFNAQPVEVKSVLTTLFGQLLGWKINGYK